MEHIKYHLNTREDKYNLVMIYYLKLDHKYLHLKVEAENQESMQDIYYEGKKVMISKEHKYSIIK